MRSPCTFYLVRHGETEWNQQGRVQGHTDIPLTSRGEEQAHARAQSFSHLPFHRIVSSDLMRAKQTAQILCQGRPLNLETTEVLREMSWGSWEGEKFDVMRAQFGSAYNAYTGTASHTIPGVESHHQVATRVQPYLCKIAENHPGDSILVVTHGGVLKSLIYHLRREELFHHHFDNLGFMQLESDGTQLNFIQASGLITYSYSGNCKSV